MFGGKGFTLCFGQNKGIAFWWCHQHLHLFVPTNRCANLVLTLCLPVRLLSHSKFVQLLSMELSGIIVVVHGDLAMAQTRFPLEQPLQLIVKSCPVLLVTASINFDNSPTDLSQTSNKLYISPLVTPTETSCTTLCIHISLGLEPLRVFFS